MTPTRSAVPARVASDRASAQQAVLSGAALDHHLGVVDDLLGAALGRVGDRSGDRPVRLRRSGEEVTGRVQDRPQPGGRDGGADRLGVTDAAPRVGQDRRGRRRQLHPGEARLLDLGEQLRCRPPLVGDVETEPAIEGIAHESSFASRTPGSVKSW